MYSASGAVRSAVADQQIGDDIDLVYDLCAGLGKQLIVTVPKHWHEQSVDINERISLASAIVQYRFLSNLILIFLNTSFTSKEKTLQQQ